MRNWIFKRQGLIKLIIVLSTFAFLCIGCGGGGGSSDGEGTGTLSVGLTDSSTGKYLAIYVTIDEVQVNKKSSSNGNSGWQTVATPMKTYNLLKLVNGITEILGENELEAGTYQQIRLIIGKTAESENNINGEPHPDANYVVLNDGSYVHLKIPSGYQTGVKLDHNFVVEDGSFVEFVLDFEACKSVVETGSGKYILNPTIKVIKTENKYYVYGKVTEYATDSAIPITGALVSAQISDGFSASVVRSTLTSEDEGEEGQYSLLLSPGQTYNMVVYSDKKVDGQLYSPACAEITIQPDGDLKQNFTLVKSDFGTIFGDVSVSGVIDPNDPPIVSISFYTTLECGNNDYIEAANLSVSPFEVTNLSVSPDASGIYSYTVELPVGEYDVVASSEGFAPDNKTAVVTSGGSVEIDLEPGGCVDSLSPSSLSFNSSGGPGSINVTASETTCSWSASESVDWIDITSGSSGSGNGTVTYEVSANTTGNFRAATITVAGQSHVVTQEPPVPGGCVDSLSPSSLSFNSSGGPGSINVTASETTCSWSASESVDWIDITSGSSGSGNGTVTYEVSANTTGNPRTAVITVADQTHTVTQAPCTFSISPPGRPFTSSGGPGSINVTASETTCSWSASESVDWIDITSGSSGSGNGTVTYEVSANTTGNPRTAVITVADQTHTVTQAPCTFSISPPGMPFTSSGGPGSINVTASSGCSWTAIEGVDWIDITSGSSGSGDGTVTYTVSANTTESSRTAVITVAGQSHTVTQEPPGVCTYSISPSSLPFTSSEGTGSISVTSSETTCSWTAIEGVDWINITSGSSGSGDGTVTYTVSANTTGSSRTAVITVAGQDHTVTQAP